MCKIDILLKNEFNKHIFDTKSEIMGVDTEINKLSSKLNVLQMKARYLKAKMWNEICEHTGEDHDNCYTNPHIDPADEIVIRQKEESDKDGDDDDEEEEEDAENKGVSSYGYIELNSPETNKRMPPPRFSLN